jgi:hypothetical protein
VTPAAAAHGNLNAVLAAGVPDLGDPSLVGRPLVVLVERNAIRAIDPETARELYTHPLRVTGHPVASGRTLVFPVRGHRLVAVDRATGFLRWSADLPGEVLTGLSITEPYVHATVTGGKGQERSRLLALSSHDGQQRWMKRSDGLFGDPAAHGKVVLVPLERDLVAFAAASGEELARVALGRRHERVEFTGRAVIAAAPDSWRDLGAGPGATVQPRTDYASLFRRDDGIDPGHDDAERLKWWVRVPADGSTPRQAVLLARRAVVSVRLDPDGRPSAAHWAFMSPDRREFVAMAVGRDLLTLVREDGAILQLSADDGTEVRAIKGGEAVMGALLLDLADPREAARHMRRMDHELVAGDLAGLMASRDPRLLPAQRLAADLSWRDDDPAHREHVMRVARGEARDDSSAAGESLRAHAAALSASPWGAASQEARDDLRRQLSVRASVVAGTTPRDLSLLARRAVVSGDAAVVPELVAHLLDPATPPGDLVELARALRDLKSAAALEGVQEFVVRYHADPDVVYESGALPLLVDYLASVRGMRDDLPAAQRAAAVLAQLVEDPFTDPHLRAYVEGRLRE